MLKVDPADIFISYKSERRRVANHLEAILQSHGYSVWYDYHLMQGKDFGFQINRRIEEAKAVIVLWCKKSVESRWVLEEASRALKLDRIVPVMIEPCKLPMGFGNIQYVNLTEWSDASPRSDRLDPLWVALEQKVGRTNETLLRVRKYHQTWRNIGAGSLSALLQRDVEPVSKDEPPGPLLARVISFETAYSPANEAQSALERQARAEWNAIRDTADAARYLAFEQKYPGSFFAEEATQLRLSCEMQSAQTAEGVSMVPPGSQADQNLAAALNEEGRVCLHVPLPHGASERTGNTWFLPGAGKREWFRDHAHCPEMVVVKPSRAFPRPFAIGRFALTFAEWDVANKVGGLGRPALLDEFGRDRRPVVDVSWEDAVAYCRWLSRLTALSYRLPTNAEWEHACRAGTTDDYWMGVVLEPEEANFGAGASPTLRPRARRGTVPVDHYAANPWGLYQVHGNVWEWTSDAAGAPDDRSPNNDGAAPLQSVRGGSWKSRVEDLRWSSRKLVPVVAKANNIGFRVLRGL